MKPFLGLFAHWDVVARQEPPAFLEKFFKDRKDGEYIISKGLKERISSRLESPRRGIGGNAGNAAVTLSDMGIPCVLSCPARAEPFMEELGKHRIFLMSGGRETSPLKCARPDAEPEHIVLEREGYRKIFNYDPVQRKFIPDEDFWDSLKNANYLFLSGFHVVPERHRKRVDEIADYLEKRKFKVHLELGRVKGLMKHSIKRLLDRGCLDSIGMNETELETVGVKGCDPKEMAERMLSFIQRSGLERMSLHSRDYRLTVFTKALERNRRAAELSIQACAAKALGGIKENLQKAGKVPLSGIRPLKSRNFLLMPSRIVENPKIIVGMGDTAAVTDSFFAMKR
jgi:ADP-dependent phosphofructokinase/glucokinase